MYIVFLKYKRKFREKKNVFLPVPECSEAHGIPFWYDFRGVSQIENVAASEQTTSFTQQLTSI